MNILLISLFWHFTNSWQAKDLNINTNYSVYTKYNL